ncbi:zinc-dependent alcohol dehydrogenase family protein [Bacillus sp. YC2]|uniref:zinc-dependent alcohol dehydrogenase family protein n=1 Tax=Bacillus sp. YC2 TaxID=2861287 RepID=UPI00223B3137|nr:zinc-dependent alcohol dehydrogenase family protein [Bacillus sp. YC2]
MLKNTALLYKAFGDPLEQLELCQKDKAPLQADEVLVKMLASPINPSDLIPISGAYSHRIKLPATAGYEGVGTVIDTGADVSQDLIGKRVVPVRGEGTWQQYAIAKAKYAIEVPSAISDHDASRLYINPLTAWLICKEMLDIQPNDLLVMNGGGTSIALIFAQLSKVLGFRLIAIARNDGGARQLQAFGAWKVINASKGHVREMIADACSGKCADYAIDAVGGAESEILASALKPTGMLVSYGLLSGIPTDWKKLHETYRLSPKLFALRLWNEHHTAEAYRRRFSEVMDLFARGDLTMNAPAAVFRFEHFKEALRCNELTKGKILLDFSSSS